MGPGSVPSRTEPGPDVLFAGPSYNRRVMKKALAPILLGLLAVSGSPGFGQVYLKARLDLDVGDHPVQVISTDFDNDGNLDLISVDRVAATISILKGVGDGTFRRLGGVVAGSQPFATAFVDATSDGIPDLLTANFLSQDVTVNPGDGQGHFGAKIASAVVGTTFNGIAVGDWNADGKIDVAMISTTGNNLTTMLGTGAGTFGTLVQFAVGTAPSQVVTADVNTDGKPDLVVVNTGSNSVQVWRGTGTGGFTLGNTL